MSKIKLSILLLISYFIFSCTSNQIVHSNQKYSVSYIGGEFDGLLLKNYLVSNLKNLNLYDQISNYKIRARIVHSSNLFITNTDNTSDRERVSTTLYVTVENHDECQIYSNDKCFTILYLCSSDKFKQSKGI